MAMPNPKRWWFALCLPIAILLSIAIPFVRTLVSAQQDAIYIYIGVMPLVLVLSVASFPIGLPALFCWSPVFLHDHFAVLVCAGYAFYMALTLWGIVRPNRIAFVLLCSLLLANVAGCQLQHAVAAISIQH